MANYTNLKNIINNVIRTNGHGDITGANLNQTLQQMVTDLGANYQYAGVATPSTNPGSHDQNVFYIATLAGTYSYFNSIVIPKGITVLRWDGSWSATTLYTVDTGLSQDSEALVQSGTVFEKFKIDGGPWDVSAHFPSAGPNNDGKFTLDYILANANTLIPTAWRKGGMSIRFVQRSDNKYVQYRLMTDGFSLTPSNWQGVDNVPTGGSNNLAKSGNVAGVAAESDITKKDKKLNSNLINPNEILTGKYIKWSGAIGNGATNFVVTGLIPINGNDIIKNGSVSSGTEIRNYVVYDANLSIVYIADADATTYTYDSSRGDKFIRLGFKTDNLTRTYPTYYANYGNTLHTYEAYTDDAEMDSIKSRLSGVETGLSTAVSEFKRLGFLNLTLLTGNNYASPSAAIAAIPSAFQYKGLEITYYDSSLERYVKARCKASTFRTEIEFWEINEFIPSIISTSTSQGQGIRALIDTKVSKKINSNIVNPEFIKTACYIHKSTGSIIVNVDPLYIVTGLIPINGNDITLSVAIQSPSDVASYVVYDENGKVVYVGANKEASYTYNASRGDRYIRLGFKSDSLPSAYPTYYANYGNTLHTYEAYTENTDIDGLLQDVEELKGGSTASIDFDTISVINNPSTLYGVWNDLNENRNYHNVLYADHLLYGLEYYDRYFGFRYQNIKEYPIIGFYNNINPSGGTTADVVPMTETVRLVSGRYFKNINISKKFTKASVGQNIKPRVLCMGDSVTESAGSNMQKISGMPQQYWSWLAWFFAQDKKDNGGNGFDFVSVGTKPLTSNPIFGATDSFTINNVTYKTYATAKGGLTIQDLNYPSQGDDPNTEEVEGEGVNPFYDSSLNRFSFAFYLDNFRTMDDNGNRLYFDVQQSTTGTAGSGNVGYLADGSVAKDADDNTLYIGKQIGDTESMNVCCPTHVVINLNHNSSYDNYVATLPAIIADIKSVVPDVFVILMDIDSTGTYTPSLYPIVPYEFAKLSKGLHDKNCRIYTYQQSLESAANKIYVCSGNLVQPLVDVIRGVFSKEADYIGTDEDIKNGISPTYPISPVQYHPNNLAHRGWGYQLYSLIKYTLSLI